MRQAPEAGKETAADFKRTAIRTGFQEDNFSVHPTMVVVADPTMVVVVTDPTMVVVVTDPTMVVAVTDPTMVVVVTDPTMVTRTHR